MQAEMLQARFTTHKNRYNPFFKDWDPQWTEDLSSKD